MCIFGSSDDHYLTSQSALYAHKIHTGYWDDLEQGTSLGFGSKYIQPEALSRHLLAGLIRMCTERVNRSILSKLLLIRQKRIKSIPFVSQPLMGKSYMDGTSFRLDFMPLMKPSLRKPQNRTLRIN